MKFNKVKKFLAAVLSLAMILSAVPANGMAAVKAAAGTLTSVQSVTADKNVVTVTFNGGIQGKITLLEDGIFRYNVDPSGEFSEYAKQNAADNDPNKVVAQIAQYQDSSDNYSHPEAVVTQEGDHWVISSGDTKIIFDKDAKMSVMAGEKVVMEEKTSLQLGSKTTQTLEEKDGEQFFGGGTQNGRFVHTGKLINIQNMSTWTDGGVASPSPFYYSTAGYGVLRNTFQSGKYDFGAADDGVVTAYHNENEFDAYYFVSDADNDTEVVQELLQGYFHVSGNPVLLPQYAFYLGHLNAYNRDNWSNESGKKAWTIKGTDAYNSAGKTTYENGGTGTILQANTHAETLNGHGPEILKDNIPEGVDFPYEFSAQAVINEYVDNDMPMGFFLPNDGYGAGYGQNGYQMTDDDSEDRIKAVEANLANLAEFASYAKKHGIETGLWTQSNLTPDAAKANEQWQLLRSFTGEVNAGVTTLKTDVAWVGKGYSFQLNAVKQAYDIMTTLDYEDGRANTRPNIISLDGWAGSQRFNSVWTGDQYGGTWEYIRFHIPTFIGQSLSGNPNIGCDMDGIWAGAPIIATRDYQWKSFAPQMLDMDGWGTYAKGPYVHGDPFTGVSRMYLKLKAMLMAYTYTNAYAAANIDTGNGDQGLPMVRAMFLEFPGEAEGYGSLSMYQYMWGKNLLVAPVYQNTKADAMGNDVRDGIYLPGGADQIWIDYFTGDQYRGGQILNGFDAPLWKLPLFVKNGAIIPMYAEHNSATAGVEKGIDRTQRLVEFWPEGTTEFNMIEDDGAYIENELDKEDKAYGAVDHISYGDHVETLYTSAVKDGTATLTANKAAGTYTGYDQNKDTTFIVHASKAPESLTAMNGETALTEVTVASKEAFDAAEAAEGTFVSFYDAAPEIETFASEKEVNIAEMVKDVKVSGKLYVKFANTDSQENAQTLVINGFENTAELPKDEVDTELAAPVLRADEEAATPTSVTLNWDAVEGADYYEIEVDGSSVLRTVKDGAVTFTHTDLDFESTHSYRIRSVGANGYSVWSEAVTATSKEDDRLRPSKDALVAAAASSSGAVSASREIGLSTENEVNVEFDMVTALAPNMTNTAVGIGSAGSNYTSYGHVPVIIRMYKDGVFGVYDGNGYKQSTLKFEQNEMYHVQVLINLEARTYSVTVTTPEGKEVMIAENFKYRSSAAVPANIGKIYLFNNEQPAGSYWLENIVLGTAEEDDGIYTAYVNGETYVSGEYNTKVELHADETKGSFVCWQAGTDAKNLKPVSVNPDYTFYLANDIYLEAVYDKEVEIKPEAALVNTLAMPTETEKVNARFVGQLTVPKGAKVLDAGLVWSSTASPETLDLESGAKVTHIQSINSAYQFSVTINGVPQGRSVRGVVFAQMKLPNGETTSVVYSVEGQVTNK